MGTMEGFLLGQALSPTPEYNSGPLWKARAQHEESNALWWKAEAEKLSASLSNKNEQVKKLSESLDKEHKRFIEERKERRSYMRGWAVRGQVLREMCGYNEERLEADSDIIDEKYNDQTIEMLNEKNVEIDTRTGF